MKELRQNERKAAVMGVVYHKEFSDYFSSLRFFLVLAILLATSVVGAVGAMATIRDFSETYSGEYIFLYLFTGSNNILPSVVSFLSYLGPIVGIVLGFDAISSERNNGTLSRILSLPIYRDTLINAKALSGVSVIGIIVLTVSAVVSGLGMAVCGIMPLASELIRVALFMLFTVVYIAFWMCLAMLFSILFRQATVSILCGLSTWLASSVFIPLFAQAFASWLFPTGTQATQEALYQNQLVQFYLLKLSPSNLYTEAVNIILNPMIRTAGPMSTVQFDGMLAGFLSIPQSLSLIWAQFVGLLALASVCFALSYILFSRQEIRA